LFVTYFVIFCNFLLFAEDPISHSHTGTWCSVTLRFTHLPTPWKVVSITTQYNYCSSKILITRQSKMWSILLAFWSMKFV
jgi:hypothetical protein